MKATMSFLRCGSLLLALPLSLILAAAPAAAQRHGDSVYAPSVGQAGKDVIWVPTPPELVEKMLRMAQVTANDFVIDLGSGDGRIAIAAAKKFGARAQGIEYNPDMVALANREAQRQGVADKVKFVKADIFASDFSQATVITMYLLPELNLKLRPRIMDLKPGTRVVSHQFNMEEWPPDETVEIDNRLAHLWIVPAKIGGAWTLSVDDTIQRRELSIRQSMQLISGQVKHSGANTALADAGLRGDQISFTVIEGGIRRDFSGRVQGSTMGGLLRSTGLPDTRWTATRR